MTKHIFTRYISGPMRGVPGYNYDTFNEVEDSLCHLFPEHRVLNPARNFDGDTSLPVTQYMAVDLLQVIESDEIVLLPGWETSGGSRREIEVAKWLDKDFALAKYDDDLGWSFELLDQPPFVDESLRGSVLDEAKALITGDRNNAYGPPTQDFRRAADAMTAYGYRHTQLPASAPPCPTCGAKPLKAHDTAISVDCVKTSRLMWTPTKRDSWVDKVGYAGCGYECAVSEAA